MVFLAPEQVPMRRARSQRYDRLTPADCALLHEASIAILEWTGVRIHDAEAVERLRGAGARAAARVDRILADHRPPPLPEDVTGAIAGILERAAATPRSALQP